MGVRCLGGAFGAVLTLKLGEFHLLLYSLLGILNVLALGEHIGYLLTGGGKLGYILQTEHSEEIGCSSVEHRTSGGVKSALSLNKSAVQKVIHSVRGIGTSKRVNKYSCYGLIVRNYGESLHRRGGKRTAFLYSESVSYLVKVILLRRKLAGIPVCKQNNAARYSRVVIFERILKNLILNLTGSHIEHSCKCGVGYRVTRREQYRLQSLLEYYYSLLYGS